MATTNLNKVFIIGNLTRDSELKSVGDSKILNFSIAVNRSIKKGDQWVSEASYFDCTMFGSRADSLSAYLKKGKKVGIVGELKQDRWEKDGQKFSKVTIIVNEIELLGGSESDKTVEPSATDNGTIPF